MSISNLVPDTSLVSNDDLDHAIILATQAGFPICEKPFHLLADKIQSTPKEIQKRMQAMLEDGRIRRMGLVPNHYRLGFVANGMSVWDVDDQDVDLAGEMVGELEMVSHCYKRPRALPGWPYNLFAMVHGRYRDEVLEKVAQIAQLLGDKSRSYDVLFSTRILKKTGMRIS